MQKRKEPAPPCEDAGPGPGARLGGQPRAWTRRVRRDLYRAAVLAWSTPLWTVRSIMETAEDRAARAASASGAWRTLLMAPRIVDMTPRFLRRCWSALRRRFLADFNVGNGTFFPGGLAPWRGLIGLECIVGQGVVRAVKRWCRPWHMPCCPTRDKRSCPQLSAGIRTRTPPRVQLAIGRSTAIPHSHGTQLCLKAERSRHFGAGSSHIWSAAGSRSSAKIAAGRGLGNRASHAGSTPGNGPARRERISLKFALHVPITKTKEPGTYACAPVSARSPARRFGSGS